MKKIFLCALILSCSFVALQAQQVVSQVTTQVQSRMTANGLEFHEVQYKSLGNNLYELEIKLKIEDGWHIFSSRTEDGGPIPLSLNIENPRMETVGQLEEECASTIEGIDKVFDMPLTKYRGHVTLRQKIRVQPQRNNTSSIPVILVAQSMGYLEYQPCTNQVCLPPLSIEILDL